MKPILFNTEMVKAILDGRKTQIRRVIPVSPIYWTNPTLLEPDCAVKFNYAAGGCQNHSSTPHFENSKYTINDILYVKEKFCIGAYANDGGCETNGYSSETYISQCSYDNNIIYYADAIDECDFSDLEKDELPIWKPSIHLKQKDARIFLKVINVSVERLQDINEYDIFNEGFTLVKMPIGNKIFINIWNSTTKDGYKWEDNPYVFVYEFERHDQ